MSEPAEKIWFRMNEQTARPAAIAAMNDKLSKVEEILKKWETTMPQITEEERSEVLAKVEEIKKWMDDKVAEQEAKEPHEDPAFSSEDVPLQSKSLERLMAKLSKKPKPKPTKKKDEEDKAENATKADGESSKDGSDTETTADSEASGADEKATDEDVKKDETKAEEATGKEEVPADDETQTEEKTDGDDEL
jgi:hypoxia up-regulated 1